MCGGLDSDPDKVRTKMKSAQMPLHLASCKNAALAGTVWRNLTPIEGKGIEFRVDGSNSVPAELLHGVTLLRFQLQVSGPRSRSHSACAVPRKCAHAGFCPFTTPNPKPCPRLIKGQIGNDVVVRSCVLSWTLAL